MTPLSPEFPASTSRSIVATTSSAVKGVPSCHVTPWRRLKVQMLLSAFGDHFSARPGAMSDASLLRAHRNSNDWLVRSYADRSTMRTGSSATLGRCAATRIVPPAVADAAAEGAPLAAAVAAADGAPPPVLAEGEAVVPLQAAMTALMEPIESPTTVARWMNWRRVMVPAM